MIEFWDGKCVYTQRVAEVIRLGEYILLQRAHDGFILPGGRVEWLEHSQAALRRELWEELRIRPELARLLWLVENLFDHENCHVHQVLTIYEVVLSEDIATDRMRAGRMCWQPMEGVQKLTLFPEFLRTRLGSIPAGVEHVCVA